MVIFHSCVNVYQRVKTFKAVEMIEEQFKNPLEHGFFLNIIEDYWRLLKTIY